MTETEQLLREIETYCAAANMAETTFGQKAVHEWSFVQRLREGRVTVRTMTRAREFIRENSASDDARSKRKRRRVA